MNKQEAIQAAKAGKKVRHKYFSENEWIQYNSLGNLIDESYQIINESDFWKLRKSPQWKTGWSLFEEYKQHGIPVNSTIAAEWVINRNENLFPESPMKWSWDWQMKLDYDGELVKIRSRFYPPSNQEEDSWSGDLIVYFGYVEKHKKEIKAQTLNELADIVESIAAEWIEKVEQAFKTIKFD